MTAPVAVFRADASPAIGGGHIMRVLALAELLQAEGWQVRLATRVETSAAVPLTRSIGQIRLEPAVVEDEPAQLADALPDGCDLLVIDSYAWGAKQEAACRPWARRIGVIDDFAASSHECDLILDPTPGRAASAYRDLAGAATTVLTGSAWAPLRPMLRTARAAAAEARRGRRANRLLIGLGMTDPSNATGRIIECLRTLGTDYGIDVVLGSAAPHRDAVARALPGHARLHIDPPHLPALMADADLAIGAGGVSALERACLGLPSLLVEVADNQRAAIAGLVAVGAARALGSFETLAPHAVSDAVTDLLQDRAALASMASAALRTVDGLGAARTAIVLAPGFARDRMAITLRPVVSGDAARILAWQHEPGLRQHFRSPGPPSAAEHRAWLAAGLENPDRILSLILCDGIPAGLLRLDRRSGSHAETHEVSILVSTPFQGRGIGRAALGLAARLLPASHLVAHVLPQNVASQALFAAAGYQETARETWTREAGA